MTFVSSPDFPSIQQTQTQTHRESPVFSGLCPAEMLAELQPSIVAAYSPYCNRFAEAVAQVALLESQSEQLRESECVLCLFRRVPTKRCPFVITRCRHGRSARELRGDVPADGGAGDGGAARAAGCLPLLPPIQTHWQGRAAGDCRQTGQPCARARAVCVLRVCVCVCVLCACVYCIVCMGVLLAFASSLCPAFPKSTF